MDFEVVKLRVFEERRPAKEQFGTRLCPEPVFSASMLTRRCLILASEEES